jgi:hypothetical protein
MAIVKTERKPFLDRLQQSVQIGTQIAGVVRSGQDMELRKQEIQQKADWFKLQSQQYEANMETARAEKRKKAQGFLFGQVANMVDLYGDIEDPKGRNAQYQSFLDTNMESFRVAASEMGSEMANDPVKFREFMMKKAEIVGPGLVTLRNTEAALRKELAVPDKAYNAERASQLLQSYSLATRKTAGHLPGEMGELLTTQSSEFQKNIEAKNARIGKAESDLAVAANKPVKPPKDVFGDTTDRLQATKYAAALENIPVVESRIAGIDEALALVDKAFTGPIKGTAAVFYGQKIAAEDAQKLEYFINKEGINAIMDFAQKAGVRAIDTEKERQYLLSAMANKTMSPEVLKMVLKRQQKFLRHIKNVAEAQRAHVQASPGGNLREFVPPAFQTEDASAPPTRNKFLEEE